MQIKAAQRDIARSLSSFPRVRSTSGPIRPRDGFGIPTLESGNSPGTLTVPSPFLLCFSVPSRARKSLRFQIKVPCHGRGREFESRCRLHSFVSSYPT